MEGPEPLVPIGGDTGTQCGGGRPGVQARPAPKGDVPGTQISDTENQDGRQYCSTDGVMNNTALQVGKK